MDFRWIPGSEIEPLLGDTFRERGWSLPDAVFSTALIAEEDGEIVGFNVVRAVIRPEPMFVEKSHRGQKNGDLAMELAKRTDAHLRKSGVERWEVIAGNRYVERLLVACGMRKLEYPTYVGGAV